MRDPRIAIASAVSFLAMSSVCAADAPSMEDLLAVIEAQQRQIDRQQEVLEQLRLKVGRLLDNREPNAPEPSNSTARTVPASFVTARQPRQVESAARGSEARPRPLSGLISSAGDFEFGGYAVTTYEDYEWETHEDRRARTDIERIILEAEYQPFERFKVEAELEFEHGGVGVTTEFDVFEEFGEFEQEVEQGCEIVIEKLQAEFLLSRGFNVKVGHVILPVGILNKEHLPSDYFTATREASRTQIIPAVWHENGIGAFGEFDIGAGGILDYEFQVVNGLDSTGFSSANWIARGYQKRFEYKVAEDLAYVFNLNYRPVPNALLGVSWYHGDSADNRPKDDTDFDADINILALFGRYALGPWSITGQYMAGELDNSDLITRANRRVSNNLGVVRSPVARTAKALFVETGYDITRLFDFPAALNIGPLELFTRYEHIDSMESVEGIVFDNPRWDRESWSVGFNYEFASGLIWKVEQNWRDLATSRMNRENTLASSVSYEF